MQSSRFCFHIPATSPPAISSLALVHLKQCFGFDATWFGGCNQQIKIILAKWDLISPRMFLEHVKLKTFAFTAATNMLRLKLLWSSEDRCGTVGEH